MKHIGLKTVEREKHAQSSMWWQNGVFLKEKREWEDILHQDNVSATLEIWKWKWLNYFSTLSGLFGYHEYYNQEIDNLDILAEQKYTVPKKC